MRTRFVEATQSIEGGFVNHGKFMVGLFDDDEWGRPPHLPEYEFSRSRPTYAEIDTLPGTPPSLLRRCGWNSAHDSRHVLVFDLQTGEGALFLPGGLPSADLTKHAIWVCPMFEPFLVWLYEHVRVEDAKHSTPLLNGRSLWFDALPSLVEIPDAPMSMAGYRRPGPQEEHDAAH